MSWAKSDGALIKLTFDKALVGDVTGLTTSDIRDYQNITGIVTASSYYSEQTKPVGATDGNWATSWYIYPWAVGTWFKVQYPVAEAFPKWRMVFNEAGYYPSTIILQGSNDDSTWVDLSTHAVANKPKEWQEFNTGNTTPYLYYRLYMTACVGGQFGILEIQFCDKLWGNESHFTITSKECDYAPEGSIVNIVRKATAVYVGDSNKEVIIEMDPKDRFESSAELTIAYDGLGTLAGSTGNVEAFSQTFVPQGLAPKPDQNATGHVEISNITATGIVVTILYKNASSGDERIEITNITAMATITHINDI